MTTDFDTAAMSKHGVFIESMLGVRGHLVEADCIPPPNVEGKCCWEVTHGGPSSDGYEWSDFTCNGCDTITAGQCRRAYNLWKDAGPPFIQFTWEPYHVCTAAGTNMIYNCCGNEPYPCDQALFKQMCGAEQGWCRRPDYPTVANHATREFCDGVGGEYHDPYPHQPDWEPTLPCCVYTQVGTRCYQWSDGECAAAGGRVMGDVGDPCDGITCPSENFWGACCYGDGTCDDHVSPDDCHAEPGSLWYACDVCEAIPCEEGACCLPDGVCEDGLTSPACAVQEGAFQGPATTCDDPEVDCESLVTVPCCLIGGGCWNATAQDCEASDGMVMEGETCDDIFNCPEDMGACCIDFHPDGNFNATCRMTTHYRCTNFGGRFFGAGELCSQTNCTEGSGACCRPSSGLCRDGEWMIRPVCEETPGDIFVPNMGPGWPAQCGITISCVGPRGACCHHWGQCNEIPEDACTTDRGIWQGAGTHCNSVLCPEVIGACCSSDSRCYLSWEESCVRHHGTFHGAGVTCEETDCGVDRVCCLPDGDCIMTGLMDCMAREGAWNGELGAGCYPGVCNSGIGACCFGQRCQNNFQYQTCIDAPDGGKFYGQGSTCRWAERDCTPGACCLAHDRCEYWTQAWCENRGGQWRGSYGDYFPDCRNVTHQSFDIDCSEPP